jgi:plasmid stabilization system protein ParE
MDHKVIWSERSIADLHEIVAFIAAHDPEIARKVGMDIYQHAMVLAQFPHIGAVYEEAENPCIHVIWCEPYRIFYRINDNDKRVDIVHIRHSARHPPML